MANERNLIPNSERTPEERRENARKAGKASAAARRRKKTMREAANLLLSLPPPKEIAKELKNMKVGKDDINNQMVILVAMYQEAAKGDVKAATFLRDTAGESPGSAPPVSEVENDPLTEAMYEEAQNGIFEKTETDINIPHN